MASPALYAAWALLVVGTLTATYFADPYIFAFTTMILGGISVGIGFIGLAVALFSKSAGWRARASIIVLVALAAAAVVVALEVLRTFKWA